MEQRPYQHEKWESQKHKSWGMPAEGFKGHVATDGSLLGNAGCMVQWRQNLRFSEPSRGQT